MLKKRKINRLFKSLFIFFVCRLGNEEFNNKNFEKSIEHYTKAIEHDGEHHVYFSNRR